MFVFEVRSVSDRASQEAMSKQIASLVAEVRRAATVRADYSA